MPTEEEVDEALTTLAAYTEDLSHIIHNRGNPAILHGKPNEQIGEIEYRGHRCGNESEVYFIGLHPELRYGIVVYFLSLQQNVAEWITEEQAEMVLDAAGIENSGNDRMKAASYLIDNSDQDSADAFDSYFRTVAGGGDHYTQVHRTDNGTFQSFAIERRIFPYEDEFSISDFSDAIHSVIGNGQKASALTMSSVSLSFDEENPGESAVEFNPY